MARAVQFTQWTFMARPGHPVFLDALGRTLRKSEEVARLSEEAVETGEEYTPVQFSGVLSAELTFWGV
jgi:mannosyltransferase OCH1-like enzyme